MKPEDSARQNQDKAVTTTTTTTTTTVTTTRTTNVDTGALAAKTRDSSPPGEPPTSKSGFPQKGKVD